MNSKVNLNDVPPTYEESNVQYKTTVPKIDNYSFKLTRGPDATCIGKHFLIADFIPYNQNFSIEDIGYLLLRANNWLQINPNYNIERCEMVPRMINSRNMLEISNCYIFNISCGRKCIVNQLRLHITISESKIEPDQICLRTIIPDLISMKELKAANFALLIKLLNINNCQPKFQNMDEVIRKINTNIEDGTITGIIINISMFYLNVYQYLKNPYVELQDDTIFYEESNRGRCHLKCLRIFYKPGPKICSNIEFKSFAADTNTIKTLDDLVNSSLNWMHDQVNHDMISLETFQEYSVKEKNELKSTTNNQNSIFFYCDGSTLLTRSEVINLYYFATTQHQIRSLQINKKKTDIIWITPRKNERNIYETYDSLMHYLGFVIANYGEHILSVESVLIPNSLLWSTIRHQTVKRYYKENGTNYQIFAFRLIVNAGSITQPVKGAPPPLASPTKYSTTCTIF